MSCLVIYGLTLCNTIKASQFGCSASLSPSDSGSDLVAFQLGYIGGFNQERPAHSWLTNRRTSAGSGYSTPFAHAVPAPSSEPRCLQALPLLQLPQAPFRLRPAWSTHNRMFP